MIPIIHIGDGATVAEPVRRWLTENASVRYLAWAENIQDGLEYCFQLNPRVVLLDSNIPTENASEAAERLSARPNSPAVILLTARQDDAFLFYLSQQRLAGAVKKSAKFHEELVTAIATCEAGGTYYSPSLKDAMRRFQASKDAFTKFLSPLEIDLVPFFAKGRTDREIAQAKSLSHLTIQTHRRDIMKKVGVHRTPELMNWARDKGFLS